MSAKIGNLVVKSSNVGSVYAISYFLFAFFDLRGPGAASEANTCSLSGALA
jgi:hypothetical protein